MELAAAEMFQDPGPPYRRDGKVSAKADVGMLRVERGTDDMVINGDLKVGE